jgi:outer membrane protein OmpA-like peptidoglycan-associated protein
VVITEGPSPAAASSPARGTVPTTLKQYEFEDVHFDRNQSALKLEATLILDGAANAMSTDPVLRLTIEGHTCSLGTSAYNLALGDRRATAVRDYLMSRGVPADRLRTVSYGEDRPKHDNSEEETRRLNRRVTLVANAP